ncbi:MAG: pyridoxal phosphate-dependent aminotransferase [Rikenellaceae bacterium]
MKCPIEKSIVEQAIAKMNIADFGRATIREVVAISNSLERECSTEFIHMEMGVPGLPAAQVGVEAEIAALQSGKASIYPLIDGVAELKQEASRFVKAFIGVDVAEQGCVSVVGSMQGTFTSFLVCGQCSEERNTILFIDPGFPVQKQQIAVLGYKYESFDVYDYRGEGLRAKLDEYLSKGNIAAIIYSNPNNPSWICLKEEELQIIGELSNKYDTIVLEDLAYFAMDFRQDLSKPFEAPYQPSVANYTDNYILLISGSKAFSYAGQRIGVVAISDKLYNRSYPGLTARYGQCTFGSAFVHRALYAISSGVSHTAQYALAAMFKAANDGEFRFLDDVKEYGRRAKRLKEIFTANGFHIVYDADMGDPIADGFYFTVGYGTMSGGELMTALIYYGVSAISLDTTGSQQSGIRACTSFIKEHQYALLEERLRLFDENYR